MVSRSGRSPSVTLADVASHAQVSLATASRVINGSTRQVQPDLRDRVLASSRLLGYVVDEQAQSMARGASQTVALVVGDIADPYFSAIAAGVSAAASRLRLTVIITTTGPGGLAEHEAVAALRPKRPLAILLAASRHLDSAGEELLLEELAGYEARGGRVSFIGADTGGSAARVVRVQNRAGARELARSLIHLGYTRFSILGGPSDLATARARVDGFAEGLASGGIAASSVEIVHGPLTRDGGHAAVLELQGLNHPGACVFAVTDVMAVGAMTALISQGRMPGRDIAVAGFDDIPLLQDVRPALTTVALPLFDIGVQALELALADPSPDSSSPEADDVRGVVRLRESTPPL
ncbi:LacI family DNA-binding transcriptional regulator [Naasia lichenicola]|uniref:LacI family transcriptional regulator n=1 Tax=Naasia lichenicola TaxID=2565933 RepID=A0A4S4FHP4_9MICO|nr:LacI family DNA-binding transcriptional regulator [Naasia lichenicola]THG29611.1 LacI family transcriptional regulator [Naasia lichenicola]